MTTFGKDTLDKLLGWFGEKPDLSELQNKRLSSWKNLPRPLLDKSFSDTRYVVVDVETSGLSLQKDHLISIGAVAVINGKICLGDSFYVVLQQSTVSHKDNILLHGIGNSAQKEGVPAKDALLNFLAFLQKDPLIAFHVTFDQTMILSALRQYLGFSLTHPWIDMAYIMPALNPGLASQHRSLDDWITHFNIRNEARHNALADALVTAQLLQVSLAQAGNRNISNFAQLRDLEKAQRWVNSIS